MFDTIELKRLDAVLRRFPKPADKVSPQGGWIGAILSAIGMTNQQLAGRLGVDPSTASRYRSRERSGSITLGRLQKAADALECDLVYALVPRPGSLDAMVHSRAEAVARRRVTRSERTMALEDQRLDAESEQAQLELLIRQLADDPPSSLWDDDAEW